MFPASYAKLLITNLAVCLDIALMRNEELVDKNLFIHTICLYEGIYP